MAAHEALCRVLEADRVAKGSGVLAAEIHRKFVIH